MEVSILLLRHSPAGKRREWAGEDRGRPLDKKGRKQADEIAKRLAAYPIKRICSSPYTRCVQTVEPLAQKLGIAIEEAPELEEGADPQEVKGLLDSVAGDLTVACTHGDIVELMVGPGEPMKKGGVWLLDAELNPVEYQGPP